ncbi:MAG: proline dehydrogenase, partial [Anaerolineae bacterium]|nr:proline dehydrogenase [Anaerolineae bacterium]
MRLGAPVRLVKGAYDEPPDIAFAGKADTDANYLQLMKQLFGDEARASGVYPAIGTHDSRLVNETREYTLRRDIPRDR